MGNWFRKLKAKWILLKAWYRGDIDWKDCKSFSEIINCYGFSKPICGGCGKVINYQFKDVSEFIGLGDLFHEGCHQLISKKINKKI